jgi:predicted PurR-regulated permease PerM
MSRLVWVSAVLALVVVAALGLRWVLADFLLDQFGSLPDSLTAAQHPEDECLASDRSEPVRSSLQSPVD